ncbi:MAG TPA: hypothetical protein PKY99_06070 [Turneriella sp.]|nr:hypothetical protein [Turneriella sp.]
MAPNARLPEVAKGVGYNAVGNLAAATPMRQVIVVGRRVDAREGIQFNLRVNLVWPVKARVLSSLEFSISFDEFKSANLLTAIFLPDFDLWRFNHPKTFIRDNLQRAYLFASIENVTVH